MTREKIKYPRSLSSLQEDLANAKDPEAQKTAFDEALKALEDERKNHIRTINDLCCATEDPEYFCNPEELKEARDEVRQSLR